MVRKLTLAGAAVLAAALVGAGVGACAKPADESRIPTRVVTVAALRAAPDTAAATGSARFEIRVGGGSSAGAGDVVATGGFAGEKVSVELDLASVLARAATSTPGASVPLGIDATMRVVVDGSSVYLQVPMLQGPGGVTGWLSLTPGDLGNVGHSLGVEVDVFDPSKVLEVLREVTAEMEVVGPAVVRGIATTHVRAAISATSPPADVVDVWIDGDGLVRRIQMVADGFPGAGAGHGGGAGSGGEMVTIELFDYGVPVEITVPAASEVTPFAELLGSFAGAGS